MRQVAVRLAMIYLMARKPDRALQALADVATTFPTDCASSVCCSRPEHRPPSVRHDDAPASRCVGPQNIRTQAVDVAAVEIGDEFKRQVMRRECIVRGWLPQARGALSRRSIQKSRFGSGDHTAGTRTSLV